MKDYSPGARLILDELDPPRCLVSASNDIFESSVSPEQIIYEQWRVNVTNNRFEIGIRFIKELLWTSGGKTQAAVYAKSGSAPSNALQEILLIF